MRYSPHAALEGAGKAILELGDPAVSKAFFRPGAAGISAGVFLEAKTIEFSLYPRQVFAIMAPRFPEWGRGL